MKEERIPLQSGAIEMRSTPSGKTNKVELKALKGALKNTKGKSPADIAKDLTDAQMKRLVIVIARRLDIIE